jgi:PAN domain
MIHAHNNYKGLDVVNTEGGEFAFPKGYANKISKVKTWQACGKLCFFKHRDETTGPCNSYTYDKSGKICYLMESGSSVGEEVDGILWCPNKKYMTG